MKSFEKKRNLTDDMELKYGKESIPGLLLTRIKRRIHLKGRFWLNYY